jgi:GMP synthase (glutamine-hydrolysing)
MKSALALRHVHFEDLGTLGAVLEGRGYRLRYLDVADGPLVGADVLEPDLVVCLGGPVGAYDTDKYPFLDEELEALEGRLARGRATLGICLGSQLMARALGARVYPSGTREIGFAPVRLTAEGAASCLAPLAADGAVLHWHGDTFDLPKQAVHLARTEVCENQAFSVGSHALALQFHVEVEPAGFERWLVGHACELASAGIEPGALRSAMVTHGPSLARKAEAILSRWLDPRGA